MITRPTRFGLAAAATIATHTLTGCVPNDAASTDNTISVDSSATDCVVSTSEAPSGNLVFRVTNSGDQVTEFYLLAADGLRIVGEAENIGPGISRDLVVLVQPGDYFTVCKPGMIGDGVGKSPFTVTESGTDRSFSGDIGTQVDVANANYTSYVKDQIENLVAGSEKFADAEASFDAYDQSKREALATQLVAYTTTLYSNVQDLQFTLDQQTNGAIGLLDEVASGKVPGEEEFWWHTDLGDFQANIDGAHVLYQGVRGILLEKDAELAATLDPEFEQVQALLDAQKVGDGFRLYTELSTSEIRAFSDQVNALAEPLSRLTAVLVL
ncbi:imelysin family protein [Salinibacterium sp. TMP30]|uniref:EfeM/EfeO family lipoprotein n=1 Tax=Salinibacterium sp. TMP30 TaxID=3138237 RepID=UPI003138A8C1